MAISIVTEPTPLMVDADVVVRVGNTRVTLDTVITAFLEGATAALNPSPREESNPAKGSEPGQRELRKDEWTEE